MANTITLKETKKLGTVIRCTSEALGNLDIYGLKNGFKVYSSKELPSLGNATVVSNPKEPRPFTYKLASNAITDGLTVESITTWYEALVKAATEPTPEPTTDAPTTEPQTSAKSSAQTSR